jgi:hypothetical protein
MFEIWILDFDLPTNNLDLKHNVDITFCATHRQFELQIVKQVLHFYIPYAICFLHHHAGILFSPP